MTARPVLKKDSEAWQLALRICKRKGASRAAVTLSPDGMSVTFMSLIRGNTWISTLEDLRLIAK